MLNYVFETTPPKKISIIIGFIIGFWGAVGSLILKKSWRYAYFKYGIVTMVTFRVLKVNNISNNVVRRNVFTVGMSPIRMVFAAQF